MLGERQGLSRIAGRMIGFFLMNDELHSLDDIAEQLSISKASASTNARLIEHMGVIERKTIPGDRRDYYRLGRQPWEDIFEMHRRRLKETSDLLGTTLVRMPAELQSQRERLAAWNHFLLFMLDELDHKIERWRELHDASRVAPVKPEAMS